MAKNKLRIKDIAALANVSTGTVDRVLHNRGDVSEETRQLILSIVEEKKYTPNLVAKSLASKKNYKIAILIPDSANDNTYWDLPYIGLKRAEDEIKNFNTEIIYFRYKPYNEKDFIQLQKEVLNLQPDGLIFAPVFPSAAKALIDNCNECQIPVILIDALIENCNSLSFFGQNAFDSGSLAARLLCYASAEEDELLILKLGYKDGIIQHQAQREEGFLHYLKAKNRKNKVATHIIDISDPQEFTNMLNDVFHNAPAIKGVFVTSSKVYKVADYFERNLINDKILIGYDLILKNAEFLSRGSIDFLLGQRTEEQGYKSVMALFSYLQMQQEIAKINYSPIDIVTQQNLPYFLQ